MSDDPFAGLDTIGDGPDMPDDGPMPEAGPSLPALPPELVAKLPEGGRFDLNDDGNGRRFQLYFGDDVIWVPRVGWFVWDGKVWSSDPDEVAVRTKSQAMSDLMKHEIGHLTLSPRQIDLLRQQAELRDMVRVLRTGLIEGAILDADDQRLVDDYENRIEMLGALLKKSGDPRSRHYSFAITTGNTGRMKALRDEAQTRLSIALDRLDAEDFAINTQSGVLRFPVDRGTCGTRDAICRPVLHPHARSDLMTKIMAVDYDPKAICPEFDKFLDEVQPDTDMQDFILRWLGLSMTALPVQMLAFWHGAGANGKSVMADVFGRMMGDYSASAKIKSLTGVDRRGGGDATPDLMLLIGARFVRASEPKEGEPLQEDLVKELTGGEPMMVRALHTNFVEFRPYFKLTISGNHKPVIRGTDDGIWRRVLLVPWNVQIPEKRRDKGLGNRLFETERAGILNRLVQALCQYREGGLMVPAQVSEATREFREESDPVGAFLDHCCVVTGETVDSIGARDLGEAFNHWLYEKGEGEWKPMTVARKLKEKAGRWKSPVTGQTFTARKASTMSYDGIRFNDTFGRTYYALHRDSQGRVLRGRSITADDF